MTGFVGIGMGAIQAGLFLPRAEEADLARTVLVRRPEQARALAAAGGVTVNVAGAAGPARLAVTGLRAATLDDPAGVEALTAAAHVAVAVSSVADYPAIAPPLAAALVAKAAGRGPRALIYASENAHGAAARLEAALVARGADPGVFQVVDTVIGKMSRTLREPAEIDALGLARGAPGLPEAWLVEAYDEIHVGAPDPARTGGGPLPRLAARADLAPFEEAKLNGHNAAHAALAYVGRLAGRPFIADVLAIPAARDLVRGAFVEETGAALIARHGGRAPLFTEGGWRAHAEDLFTRMANPWLRDDCARVGRDTARKLGWDDRLVGTIRLVEGAGLPARRWHVALHAALAAAAVRPETLAASWRAAGAGRHEAAAMLRRIDAHRAAFETWRRDLAADHPPKEPA